MMKVIAAVLLASLHYTLADPPTSFRNGYKLTDADILNYALTLEHLEDKFYREGLANYTHEEFVRAGFADPFYANLQAVSKDETAHVAFLTGALKQAGVKPVPECTYGFPVADPKSFVAFSSVLEGVGVSAYLGAAADILSDQYLTAAGSILTVESRHSAYIRSALGEKPFPAPFDVPLDPNEVHSIAHGLILFCPPDTPALPVKAFPALALRTTGTITTGTTITVLTPGYTLKARHATAGLNGAFVSVTGPVFVDVTLVPGGFTTTVPPGIAGQSYFLLTNCKEKVTDDTVVAGPVVVEVTA